MRRRFSICTISTLFTTLLCATVEVHCGKYKNFIDWPILYVVVHCATINGLQRVTFRWTPLGMSEERGERENWLLRTRTVWTTAKPRAGIYYAVVQDGLLKRVIYIQLHSSGGID